ncbi:putative zinc finger protein [Gregarina niphandrodes]|uniref:Zinc finger protein n=1 Tax=Gregarina niphandrodes TaxID=110365 RepID=A0A023BBE9_GRENI|nr:putative zinc finger protein [Gregarina niphandrodes]EZG79587.1 putative zinc finger protein [Gregarina niphandrodes]|eukprot:XP_011134411.1 putative zinc finger protein [Gregarina niphandrodes]
MALPRTMESSDLLKFRTRACQRWIKGSKCSFGDKCQYSHDLTWPRRPLWEVNYSETLCTYAASQQQEQCPFLRNCPHSHTETEALYHPHVYKTVLCREFNRSGRCGRYYCPYAHGQHELRSKKEIHNSTSEELSTTDDLATEGVSVSENSDRKGPVESGRNGSSEAGLAAASPQSEHAENDLPDPGPNIGHPIHSTLDRDPTAGSRPIADDDPPSLKGRLAGSNTSDGNHMSDGNNLSDANNLAELSELTECSPAEGSRMEASHIHKRFSISRSAELADDDDADGVIYVSKDMLQGPPTPTTAAAATAELRSRGAFSAACDMACGLFA